MKSIVVGTIKSGKTHHVKYQIECLVNDGVYEQIYIYSDNECEYENMTFFNSVTLIFISSLPEVENGKYKKSLFIVDIDRKLSHKEKMILYIYFEHVEISIMYVINTCIRFNDIRLPTEDIKDLAKKNVIMPEIYELIKKRIEDKKCYRGKLRMRSSFPIILVILWRHQLSGLKPRLYKNH